jgi:transaldolase
MKAPDIKTKLFLDSGDPAESRQAKELLGRLDGQTTNPSLIAKNPDLRRRIDSGDRLTREEANEFYKKTLQEIAEVTDGPLSVEVYADEKSSPDDLYRQAMVMCEWVTNAYIKYPTTAAGLEAAERTVAEGIPVNMTLCFTQEQAAAIYSATRATKQPAFVSPFVGRLDDRGENGMELISNILRMLEPGDGHLLTLTASVRNEQHLIYALALGSPLITAPLSSYEAWAKSGYPVPDPTYRYDFGDLTPLPYLDVPIDKDWRDYDIHHDLTAAGQKKFAADWASLIVEESAKS